ncbi:probable splicing factor, arginine/serine-rich 6 [Corticium candelabrum]|uniref:probable splicing factor, arginine/serine-rich 6 n=1 Tax=Corticium candelabrum TaxID=121492 RepID=UPI002E255B0E|nr:probable splicing factor, arginine/serine-rich 6 [Corticium candelabrum]
MSLKGGYTVFVGRLSRKTHPRDLEDVFGRYGPFTRCDIKLGPGMAYGFIEYEDKRDAEDAIRSENGRELLGCNMVVEWARGEGPGSGSTRERGGYSGGGYGGGGGYGRRRDSRSPPRRSRRYSPVAERSYDRDRNYSRSQEKRSRDRYERRSRSRDRRGSRSPVRRDRGSTRDLKRRSRSRSAEGDRRRSTGTGDRGRSGSHNRLSPGRDLSPRRQSDSGDDREH